jgi:hypothetical protein
MFNYQLENEPRVHVTRALPLPSFDEIQLRPHLYLNDVGQWQAYVYERGGIHKWVVEFLNELRVFLFDHGLNGTVALRPAALTATRMEFKIGSDTTFTVPLPSFRVVMVRQSHTTDTVD